MAAFIRFTQAMVFALVLIATVAHSNENQPTPTQPTSTTMDPYTVVIDVTDQLMRVVSTGKTALQNDPQSYFSKVRTIMEVAVDFGYIAKNVMGASHWRAATKAQREQFIEVFTQGLVETYAKGMANFSEFDISLQAPVADVGEKRKIEVIQQFKGPEGINLVSYTMGKHKNGDWKLINVVLDGVNLGKTLRSQFAQSVVEHQGSLEAAIAGWTWKS